MKKSWLPICCRRAERLLCLGCQPKLKRLADKRSPFQMNPQNPYTHGVHRTAPRANPPGARSSRPGAFRARSTAVGAGGGRTAQGQNHFREDTEFVHERTDAACVPGRRGQDSETHEEERVSRPPCPRRHQRSVQPLYAHVIQRPRRGPMSRARPVPPECGLLPRHPTPPTQPMPGSGAERPGLVVVFRRVT